MDHKSSHRRIAGQGDNHQPVPRKDFKVLASYGHVRDLPSKDGAVDPDNDFAMTYELNEDSEKHVRSIVKAAKKAEAVYLATDLDREGEAISWHIYEILREEGLTEKMPFYRVEFSEITEKAIQDAVDNPRELSMDLVNAQQARRALDHLVGFNLSPLLWKKIKTGLSAGRVQSPALRMIVEREREIEAFEPQEYWTIEADMNHQDQAFQSRLVRLKNERLKQFDISDAEHAHQVRDRLIKAADGKLQVDRVTRKQRKRRPAPPFITSTLQQDAARKLRFSAQRTMRTAQNLYEAGHITYMRTDSVHLSNDALRTCADRSRKFGAEYLPEKPNFYKTKSKNAQEAHEAIRPTSAADDPIRLKSSLTEDQFRLYELIWRRAMASQMVPALIDTVAVEFDCDSDATFRANGSVIAFPGFLSVYEVSQPQGKEEKETSLPDMKEGDMVSFRRFGPSSTLPSHRRVSRKPAWSRRWKTSESAARRPMPASSRPWCAANTWNWTAGGSFRPIPGGWSHDSWKTISSLTWIMNLPRGWKTPWMRFPGRDTLDSAVDAVLEALHRADQRQARDSQPAGSQAHARARHGSRHRKRGFRTSRTVWPARTDRQRGR